MFKTQPKRLLLGKIREKGNLIYYEFCDIGNGTFFDSELHLNFNFSKVETKFI